jgi:CRP-like cAMP-binding protein
MMISVIWFFPAGALGELLLQYKALQHRVMRLEAELLGSNRRSP